MIFVPLYLCELHTFKMFCSLIESKNGKMSVRKIGREDGLTLLKGTEARGK